MNIKNLRCYSKILVVTLATSITLCGCKTGKMIKDEEEKNIEPITIESLQENTFTKQIENDYEKLISINVEYDDKNGKYLLTGSVENTKVEKIEGEEKELDDVFSLVKHATNLESITISSDYAEDMEILAHIANKEKVKNVVIASSYEYENLDFLIEFENIEDLLLSVNSIDYSVINHFQKIKSLYLYHCTGDDTFLPALDLPELKTLSISPKNAKKYNSEFINSINNLKKLEILDARGVLVNDINFLEGLTSLKCLNLGKSYILDITAAKTLTGLKYLYLEDNYIMDITPLYDLPNLKIVKLEGNCLAEEMITPLVNKGIYTKIVADTTFKSQTNPLIKEKSWKYGN